MSRDTWKARLGAVVSDSGTSFCVWAPRPGSVTLILDGHERPMRRDTDGHWETFEPTAGAGRRYRYRVDGTDLPDPCSRSQPDGVHGDSEIIDPRSFAWTDSAWRAPAREDLVIYECHVGTLSEHGDFNGAIAEFERIHELGITAVELMPVASFPGNRNWGYDGVDLFAPAWTYGGPDGLKRLVDAAHSQGLAVILDVVYNHFGPDGNYTERFGPYQTKRHHTPWGDAVNFDDEGSDGVREFVVENLLHWVHEYHVDGFRFDATHAIHDDSREHILAEIHRQIARFARGGRLPYLTAETDENDPRYLRPLEQGGFGFDAVWADDFHHVVHNNLHSERDGYLSAFEGTVRELATVVEQGWLHQGQIDRGTGKPRGGSPSGLAWRHFVYCLQNHDQVGNRAFGERISTTSNRDDIRAATALLLLLPQTPLIFQGQEFAATTPFLYFTDHEPKLGPAVTAGRRREFAGFAAFRDPALREQIPDPQSEQTFLRSRLDSAELARPEGQEALAFHRALLQIRFSDPALRAAREDQAPIRTTVQNNALLVRIETGPGARLIAVNFGDETTSFQAECVQSLFWTGPAVREAHPALLEVPGHSAVFAAAD